MARSHFGGEPCFEGDANREAAVIVTRVGRVREAIGALLERGLAERGGIFR